MSYVKNTMVDTLLSLFAPHLCSSCGRIGSLFCDDCKSYIIKPPNEVCWVCGVISSINTCRKCTELFDETIIVGLRQGGLQRLIGGFKFQYMRAGAKRCAELLAPLLHGCEVDIIVPIPTITSNVRIRGYDHMALIAYYLSKLLMVPVAPILVTSSRQTQHHLSRKDRLLNAGSRFELTGRIETSKSYLIVDDIITTGSTVKQAAKLLRSAGATHVSVAAIARQPSTKPAISVKMGKVPQDTHEER